MFSKHERSSVLWTRLAYLLAVFWLVACLQSAVVTASPAHLVARQDDDTLPDDPNDVDDPVAAGDPVPTEDKYPSLDDCRSKCNVDTDKSVFYSQVGPHEDKPEKFASQEGKILVRESYPSGFTDKKSDSTGYTKFAQRFSQAFSEKTSGIAHVLLPTDGTSLDKRVWTKIEYPILTGSNGACTRIMKVDPDDFTKRCILWDRGDNYDDKNYARCNDNNGAVPPPPAPEVVCPLSNDDHWPTCDECPNSYNQDSCIASEASAACNCADPCGNTNCIL